MSVWGKIIGGVAGFAMGGPIGALIGAFAGHQLDRMGGGGTPAEADAGDDREVAFTIAVIVLSAKMAKADGAVSRDEIAAFRRMVHIPPAEAAEVGRIFNAARRDAAGYEPYAEQVAGLFRHEPAVLEDLLGVLFAIARADGPLRPAELRYLRHVAHIFGFADHAFERIRATHAGPSEADPYEVLGVAREADADEIKRAYRKLMRENHPDTLIAQGLPKEFIDTATAKVATINAAYDRIREMRGLA